MSENWNIRHFSPSASETGDQCVDHTPLVYPPVLLILD